MKSQGGGAFGHHTVAVACYLSHSVITIEAAAVAIEAHGDYGMPVYDLLAHEQPFLPETGERQNVNCRRFRQIFFKNNSLRLPFDTLPFHPTHSKKYTLASLCHNHIHDKIVYIPIPFL